jgi:hypothetical protein
MSRPPEKPKRKNNNTRARTSGEDERLLQLIISNVSDIDIAAELGRTVMAVRTRAYALRIALGRSSVSGKGNIFVAETKPRRRRT